MGGLFFQALLAYQGCKSNVHFITTAVKFNSYWRCFLTPV